MMTLMKMVAGAVGALILFFAVGFYKTTGSSEAVDQFFGSIKSGDLVLAYDQLDNATQQELSNAGFKNYLNQIMLVDLKSYEATKTGFGYGVNKNDKSKFKVRVTTANDEVLTFKVAAEENNKAWKVRSLLLPDDSNSESVMSQVRTPSIPDEGDLGKLLMAANVAFAHSAKEEDFTLFRSHVSELMREQFSLERLNDAYQPVYEIGSQLVKIIEDDEKTVLEAIPEIDREGLLVVKFKTLTDQFTYSFQHKYLYENYEWKIAGYEVNLLPSELYQKTSM